MTVSLAGSFGGDPGRLVLDEVSRRRDWSDRAFARWAGIDETLLSHWRAGRRAMPVWALPLLARYTGDPEAVYGDLLRRASCGLVVEDPEEPSQPEVAVHEVRKGMGSVLTAVEEATDPKSPSGSDISPDEALPLLGQVEMLHEATGELVRGLHRRRGEGRK